MINKTISHYKILSKLGEGGMGVVYRAQDLQLEREVAIKFLPDRIASNTEERERFKTEAKAAAALNHANIATIYNIEEAEDQTFIVMEYVDGVELKERIDKGSLPVPEMLDIARQIGAGLQAAHEKGIVHRDIKSANIMLTQKGEVKIMDFGLAKRGGQAGPTKEGTTLGTVAYMSPEQTRGDEVDHRSDIFSLGVLLYEMIAGQLPFKGDYDQAVIYSILNEEPASLASLRDDLPEGLDSLVLRTMAKDVDQRYQNIAELLRDIQKILDQSKGEGGGRTLMQEIRRPKVVVPAIVIIVFLVVSVVWWINRQSGMRWALQEALPAIEALSADLGVGSNAWLAFTLAHEANEHISGDPALSRHWANISRFASIDSDPPGAQIFLKPYSDSNADWRPFGVTPIDSVRIPVGFSRLRLEHQGFAAVEDLVSIRSWTQVFRQSYQLSAIMAVPDGMVFVEGSNRQNLFMPGLDHLPRKPLPDFWMDRFEVTNMAYKAFVDAGGYSNRDYWRQSLIRSGGEIGWDQAMAAFIDKTGRPGPATWEAGDYPEGQDNYPVQGISWFEAAAYAEFVGKSLPTIYHWNRAAQTTASGAIVPLSNLDSDRMAEVGSHAGISRYGIYDLAGNVREWILNSSSRPGHRFILGGGWSDAAYAFNDAYSQDAWDRSAINGFRCIKSVDPIEDHSNLAHSIDLPFRDYTKERAIPDREFNLLIRQFEYDKTPLNARRESTDDSHEDWTKETITFDAAYGNDRVLAYMYLPKNVKPPYQVVVVFPGDAGFNGGSSANRPPSRAYDFVAKTGRALFRPVYKSTFERKDDLPSSMPNQSNSYKEHVIMWSKDNSRAVDYLETRPDIDKDKIAFYGFSWGGRMAPVILATDNRYKAACLTVAGLRFQLTQPEADPFNFLPRVTLPVLMINGRYDFYFPEQTSQKPFFENLGTPDAHKKWLVYDGAHNVPRADLVKEALAWLDLYLGPVEK